MTFMQPRDVRERSTPVYFLLLTAVFVVVLYILRDASSVFDVNLLKDSVSEFGVAELDVYIPPGRKDDFYQNINILFDGQTIPVSIDTSTADTFVASDECDTVDRESGCYQLQETYRISSETNFIPDQDFDTYLGKGRVIGNLSLVTSQLGGIISSNTTTALIEYAMRDEFQNGSFAGVLGLGLRPASQQWLKHTRLPMIDNLIAEKKLRSPLFSLISPRYGDGTQKIGKLTLGAIDRDAPTDVVYRNVMPFSRNPDKLGKLETVAWSTGLQGIRINGAEVLVSPGRLRNDAQHVSVLDSGASYLYLRTPDFYFIVPKFNGITFTEKDPVGDRLYFECARSQLLELKLHDAWYPIDPLDMLVPNSRFVVNGTEMCQASIKTWDMTTFGDSLLGLPFLRSIFAVFDYVSKDLHSVPPRLGLASMVDRHTAEQRYHSMYIKRLE